MKHMIVWFVFGSLALAQSEAPDISSWFSSTASLAAVVAALLALLRKHVLKIDGVAVIVASLVLGVALAFAGKLLGYLGNDWLFFGLSAGFVASGGIDLLRGIARGSNAQAADYSADADSERARLR